MASQLAVVAATASEQTAINLLEPRLSTMLATAGCTWATMEKLSEAKLISLDLLVEIADDKVGLGAFLKSDHCGMVDPIEIAKVRSVYAKATVRVTMEATRTTERALSNLPPQLGLGELDLARKAYEIAFEKLPKAELPSQGYFERKNGEVETMFKAEKLSSVTNMAQQDSNTTSAPAFTPEGFFKIQTKEFGIAMPDTSESLRSRIMVIGVTSVMIRMRHPEKGALQSTTIQVFERYVKWLMGPKVWQLVSKGIDGRPIACPTLAHVLAYDLAIRENVAELMNTGCDLAMAYQLSMGDSEIRQESFLTSYACDSTSAGCRALSAPGLKESYNMSTPSGQKRSYADMEEEDWVKPRGGKGKGEKGEGKGAKARKRANAKKAADAAAAKKAANDVNPDYPRKGGGGGGAAKGKGKDKGKGPRNAPPNAHTHDKNGKGLCYGYNDQGCARGTDCNFAHACWVCLGSHPGSKCR